jgi:hypothetical protein
MIAKIRRMIKSIRGSGKLADKFKILTGRESLCLRLDCPTRWASLGHMLKDYLKNFDDIHSVTLKSLSVD